MLWVTSDGIRTTIPANATLMYTSKHRPLSRFGMPHVTQFSSFLTKSCQLFPLVLPPLYIPRIPHLLERRLGLHLLFVLDDKSTSNTSVFLLVRAERFQPGHFGVLLPTATKSKMPSMVRTFKVTNRISYRKRVVHQARASCPYLRWCFDIAVRCIDITC